MEGIFQDLPPELPILYGSFDFSSDAPAAMLMRPEKHHLLAPGQVFVPKENDSYDGILNEAGLALLEKIHASLHESKATLVGTLHTERTGAKQFEGVFALCTHENRIFCGDIVAAADKTIVGLPITTSLIVFCEIDEEGIGWVQTKTGSIYLVKGRETKPLVKLD
jgi:hypothetical protein